MLGVLQGDSLSADREGHQIQFSTALMGCALHRQVGGHEYSGPVLVRPFPQDVSVYHQREKRVVKWVLHFSQVNPCEECLMHIFTEAGTHVPEVEQHLYRCDNPKNCVKLH